MGLFSKVKDWIAPAINPVGLIGTGSQLVGDYLSQEAQERENSRARQHQDQVNIANAELQREFAKNGVRWRVEDAVSAGLHPLAALGASGASASPSFQMPAYQDSPKANMYRSMGQNVSRAIMSTATAEERALSRLQIERMSLENQLLRQRVQTDQQPPAFPADGNSEIGIPGQGSSVTPVTIVPLGRTASPKGKPSQAYGDLTMYTYTKHPDGSLEPMSSPDSQGDKANDFIAMIKHHVNMFAHKYANPGSMSPSYQDHPLPEDKYWKFSYFTGRYHPAPIPKGVHWSATRSKYWKN